MSRTGPDWAALRASLGDQRLLGMSLDAGGHLTHGYRPNISGKMFHQRNYGTDPKTGLLDYDQVREIAREFRPLILVAGYSAFPRLVNFRVMREIADEVGATLMVDMAHFAGLVAGKVMEGDFDPVQHANIVTNRNTVPQDPNGAWYTSGVRLGTPALTTRGFGTAEMAEIADLIDTVLRQTTPGTDADRTPSKARYVMQDGVAAKVGGRVTELLAGFPLYPEIDLGSR